MAAASSDSNKSGDWTEIQGKDVLLKVSHGLEAMETISSRLVVRLIIYNPRSPHPLYLLSYYCYYQITETRPT